MLLHDYLGFIVNSVTHLKCQGYCNILCNKIVNYLVIIQVGKRTSASLSELSEQKQILIIKGLICIVKLSDMLTSIEVLKFVQWLPARTVTTPRLYYICLLRTTQFCRTGFLQTVGRALLLLDKVPILPFYW